MSNDSADKEQLPPRVLLVEDEPSLAFNLQLNLDAEGYRVRHVLTGKDALETWKDHGPFDLVILDVMIPDCLKDFENDYEPGSPRRNGFHVAQVIRQDNSLVPIIMLTALASESDRLRGLETGVDDYITKPFHLAEFLLKVRRAIERGQVTSAAKSLRKLDKKGSVSYLGYTLDINELQVSRGDEINRLTEIETGMVREFFSKPESVLTRQYLLEEVWQQTGQVDTRTVDNFIRLLRVLFDKKPKIIEIESIRGRGYRMRPFKKSEK